MKILGLIPARGGSKGVPHKNIKQLHGKPLIAYTIEAGLACPLIADVVVSTDDEEIAEISKSYGAQVPFLRPEALASDQSPTIDMVIHALQYFSEMNIHYDAVCLLQPTVPFRNASDVVDAIEKFAFSDADCLFTTREVPHVYNPYWVFEEDHESGQLKKVITASHLIKRRQELPKVYHRDGSIYLTKSEVILHQKSLYGEKIIHHIMSASPNINIDTMEDWKMAEGFLKNDPTFSQEKLDSNDQNPI